MLMLKTFWLKVDREVNPSNKKDHLHVKNIYFAKQKIKVYENSIQNITKSQTSATFFFSKQDSLN